MKIHSTEKSKTCTVDNCNESKSLAKGLCKKHYSRVRYKKVRDVELANKKIYQRENKERLTKYAKEYYQKNKQHIYERTRRNTQKRLQSDINFKLAHNLRARLNSAIKNSNKAGSAVEELGCSIEFLKKHLESQFQPGMTWENHGKWHIDHIKPLAKYTLTDKKQFKEACHYTNLQPLWSTDNLTKKDGYEDPQYRKS